MEHIQKQVIDQWETFTIWNAGKQGKKFYRFLTTTNQKKVLFFIFFSQWKTQAFHTRNVTLAQFL